MNTTEHKKYLDEFSSFTEKLLASETKTTVFLKDAKINTPTGRLTKIYSKTTIKVSRTLIKR